MLLLDTCTLLWLTSEQGKISSVAEQLLTVYRDDLYLSAMTAWEIAWKQRKGKLTLPLAAADWIDLIVFDLKLYELPV